METGNDDDLETSSGDGADRAPGGDPITGVLAAAFELPIPDEVFVRVRQALSEQVQLRREDADDTNDLDAEFTDMLAAAFDEDADLDRPAATDERPTGLLDDDLEDGLGDGCPSSRGR